jgi:hypothetical protein
LDILRELAPHQLNTPLFAPQHGGARNSRQDELGHTAHRALAQQKPIKTLFSFCHKYYCISTQMVAQQGPSKLCQPPCPHGGVTATLSQETPLSFLKMVKMASANKQQKPGKTRGKKREAENCIKTVQEATDKSKQLLTDI